ncbi:MAG: ATP-dependent endonuclease [Bdellovibrionales bacterium RBG_16_40_8]|nr:MAG: ATP-dependent endonuclease [Bdellovibrionales bacterium RBG_16_40_8]
MNILVDTVRISGFRGIKNLEMTLPRVTVLIGTNNSGKTSLLKALQLALGDYSRYISEEDFFIGSDEKRVNEINVDVRFVPVDNNGNRVAVFDDVWLTDFGDKIKAEANGNQFMALRTRVKPNDIKGGFECTRFAMQTWPEFAVWLDEKPKEKDKINKIISTPFISIEAQRDIHYELKDKSSFAGKVLSGVEYQKEDIIEIEKLINDLNLSAIEKSEALKNFKTHLEQLNQSFQGAGNVEITPFPKKIRDLSKHFSVHFGENANGVFSMEYHGMGTRSWASMLTVKAFIESAAAKHEEEVEPFFPILAAEEPEAHLHPNAQKTLYQQLADTKGQVIVSTHSPYFAAMADIMDIRSLRKDATGITAMRLTKDYTAEEKKILSREITSKRGEILFARALILCEGITEEQIIPAFFDICSDKSFFSLGLCCINVGGKNYPPFIKLACSLGIPTFIVSDNDGDTKTTVEAQIAKIKTDHGLGLGTDIFGVSYLAAGNDFEAELMSIALLRDEIITAVVLSETNATINAQYKAAKLTEVSALNDVDLIARMRGTKSSYSGFLADVVRENPNGKAPETITPAAITAALTQIKTWLVV